MRTLKGMTTQQKIRQLGLVEEITQLHCSKPPPTHQQGKVPIDGILLSPSLLEGARGGYLALDDGLGSNPIPITTGRSKRQLFCF